MNLSLTHKLVGEHLLGGEPVPGRELALRIDQVLTKDNTGTQVYLQFEAWACRGCARRRS